MTFKPTHRTKFARTQLMQISPDVYENSEGYRMLINNDDIEPIPQKEPVKLEPGKRYRWTVEGTVTEAYELRIGGQTIFGQTMDLGVLERIPDPLPTTPGSVVHDQNGTKYMRLDVTSAAQWVRTDGYTRGDDEIVGATVIFDAGADK